MRRANYNPSTEDALRRRIMGAATSLGFLAYHTRNSFGSDKGFPDIVVSGPIDYPVALFFYETKGPRGIVEPEQQLWLDVLDAIGMSFGTGMFRAALITLDNERSVYDDLEAAFQLSVLKRSQRS